MALHRIPFQTYNRPVLDMLIYAEEDGRIDERYDFNPPYQRASVWTPEQRVELIRSLMQGLPIGAVFLNRRSILEPQRVVDGKQRLETLLMWIRDEVHVPRDWFPASHLCVIPGGTAGDVVSWSDLSLLGQRHLGNDWSIAAYETELRTEAQEAELYARINYGGTPHEPLTR